MEKLNNGEVKAIASRIKKELDVIIDQKNQNLKESYLKSGEGQRLVELLNQITEKVSIIDKIQEEVHDLRKILIDDYYYYSYDYELDSVISEIAPKIPHADLNELKDSIILANLESIDLNNLIDYVKDNYRFETEDKRKK